MTLIDSKLFSYSGLFKSDQFGAQNVKTLIYSDFGAVTKDVFDHSEFIENEMDGFMHLESEIEFASGGNLGLKISENSKSVKILLSDGALPISKTNFPIIEAELEKILYACERHQSISKKLNEELTDLVEHHLDDALKRRKDIGDALVADLKELDRSHEEDICRLRADYGIHV
eukprot:508033_1